MLWNCAIGEDSFESPLDCKEIQPVHPKGNQSWIFIQRTDATWCKELTPWKRPCCWARLKAGREELTEDKMVGWHYQVDGHEFEQTPRDGDRQGSLACFSPWGCKQLDTTEWLNWLNDWKLFLKHQMETSFLIDHRLMFSHTSIISIQITKLYHTILITKTLL